MMLSCVGWVTCSVWFSFGIVQNFVIIFLKAEKFRTIDGISAIGSSMPKLVQILNKNEKSLEDLKKIFTRWMVFQLLLISLPFRVCSLWARYLTTFVIRHGPSQFPASFPTPASLIFGNTLHSTDLPSLKVLILTCQMKCQAIFCYYGAVRIKAFSLCSFGRSNS